MRSIQKRHWVAIFVIVAEAASSSACTSGADLPSGTNNDDAAVDAFAERAERPSAESGDAIDMVAQPDARSPDPGSELDAARDAQIGTDSGASRDGGRLADATLVDGRPPSTEAATPPADAGAAPYKGVANAACGDLTRLNASWWYNWTLSPGACAAGEFVPMISGKNEKTAAAVTNAMNLVTRAGYHAVLAFNEPNKVDQANLTVAQVVSLWPPLASNASIRVSTPATSADAQSWFVDFMTQAAAQTLRTDFVAIHWYGWNAGSCDRNAATLESYIQWAERASGNLPIWITEWGCMNLSNPDAATVQAFFVGALAMFQRHPRIQRHAWYPWLPHNELVNTDGTLTPLGMLYAEAPASK